MSQPRGYLGTPGEVIQAAGEIRDSKIPAWQKIAELGIELANDELLAIAARMLKEHYIDQRTSIMTASDR